MNSLENVFQTVPWLFSKLLGVFPTVHSSNLQCGKRIHLIIGQKVLKVEKSNLFHFLPVTLRTTFEKTKFARILSFQVEKWGYQAKVHPVSTFGLDIVPLLSTYIFQLENTKLPLIWCFQLFSTTVTGKK